MAAQFPDNPPSSQFRLIDAAETTVRLACRKQITLDNAQHPLRDWRSFMKYAITGSGKIGAALARTFARKNIEVAIANSRGPETLASLRDELGPSVFPQSIQDAYKAGMIFLAVPFPLTRMLRSNSSSGTARS
jgi:NADP oxidoreductase coenzyme F420-dependent